MQAHRAQTRTSTATPRRCSLSAAWHATRLSRAVRLPREVKLARGVKLAREAVLPREAMLARGVKLPREAVLARGVKLPRKVVGSKHDESSYLTRLNRDRQLAGEVYVDMASSLVCCSLGFL